MRDKRETKSVVGRRRIEREYSKGIEKRDCHDLNFLIMINVKSTSIKILQALLDYLVIRIH